MCRCVCVYLCMSWDCEREAYVYVHAYVSSRHMQVVRESEHLFTYTYRYTA